MQVKIDDYKFDTARQQPLEGEVAKLERAKSADPWKLDGLDDKTQELDTLKVNDLVSTLDDLKLAGVRPKPKGINADLSVDREVANDRLLISALAQDLRAHGFEIAPDRDNKQRLRLYARGGELEAATSKGVVYTMRFGDVFAGAEEEIEIGGGEKKADADKENPADADEAKEADGESGKQSSRFLMVSAQFDETYVGARPEKPAPPEGLPADLVAEVEKKFEKKASRDKARIRPGTKSSPGKEGAAKDEAPQEEKEEEECGGADAAQADDNKDSAADKPAEPADDKVDSAKKENDGEKADDEPPSVDELKKKYQTLYEKYDADLRAYDTRVKEGEEKAADLNLRFGEWYYLISASDYKKLHVPRTELVKAKAQAPDDQEKSKSSAAEDSAPASGDEVENEATDKDEDKDEESKEAAPEP
jgi:hypothetical protein